MKLNLFEDAWVDDSGPANDTGAVVDDRRGSPGGNVTAYIHSISIFGEMEIRFNATMFTDFNFSTLNSSLVDIYVIPFNPEPDFNMSHVNFTWNLTYYQDDVMRIQMNFSHPKSISLNLEQDTIVFHIKNETQAFYSP